MNIDHVDRLISLPASILREVLAGRVVNTERLCTACHIRFVSDSNKHGRCLECGIPKRGMS